MTVAAKPSRKLISGSGWSNPLQFDIYIEDETHVEVWADDVQLALGTDYTVTGVAETAGFSVFINTPGSWAPTTWVLEHVPPIDQDVDLTLGGLFGQAYETAADRIIRRLQFLNDLAQRAWKAPRDTFDAARTLSVLEEGHFWKADADGNMVDGGSATLIANSEANAVAAAASAVEAAEAEAGAVIAQTGAEAAAAEAAATVADKVSKSGDTMTGALTVPINTGLRLGNGGALYDTSDTTVILTNGNSLRVFNEAGTTEILRAREADAAPEFKGQVIYHAGNLPETPSSVTVATRAALKAVDYTLNPTVYLAEGVPAAVGRMGVFDWVAGNFSTQAAADTAEGVYLVSNLAAATVGIWRRREFKGFDYQAEWFGVKPDDNAAAAANSNALDAIHDMPGTRMRILLPMGLCAISRMFEITKMISWKGVSKFASGLIAIGFTVGASNALLDYQGADGNRLQNIRAEQMALWSDNSNGRGMRLTWVNKSNFEDLTLYQLHTGWTGDNAWSNNFKNVSAFGIAQETVLLGDQCNNLHMDRCEFRGINGLRAIGGMSNLTFTGCNHEGITDAGGRGLLFEPATGKLIDGITIQGCHWESVEGAAIAFAGADADSCQGIVVEGNYINGGHTAVGAVADMAIVIVNARGFEIRNNKIVDWDMFAFFTDGTARSGEVVDNVIKDCPGFTTNNGSTEADSWHASVLVRNNWDATNGRFMGRSEEWLDDIPAAGYRAAGSKVWIKNPTRDANNMTLIAATKKTTGTNNVVGTDWERHYTSHVSPAT